VRIKIDEDLPRAVADVLRAAGHHVVTVPEQGWSGWADARIWTAMRTEGRILVTADKGFADLRRFRNAGGSVGIVLFRVQRESWKSYHTLANRLVDSVDLGQLKGAVAVVTEKGIRVRRA
jgi:predicted nuclease of predicted toxin-antitoxin system